MDSDVIRFRGTKDNDHWPIVIATRKIAYIAKIDGKHCRVVLDNGEAIEIEEQLSVAEARWSLALSALEAINK